MPAANETSSAGWYEPFPVIGAVPTVVPPVMHVVGAVACWKTLKVIVPDGLPLMPVIVAVMDDAGMAAPAAAVDGAESVTTSGRTRSNVDVRFAGYVPRSGTVSVTEFEPMPPAVALAVYCRPETNPVGTV